MIQLLLKPSRAQYVALSLLTASTLAVASSVNALGQTNASASTPAAAANAALVGEYTADDGSTISVAITDGLLRLTSGPMTFTLDPLDGGRYRARERNIIFTFAGDFLTVAEGGRLVATGTRGQAPDAPVQPQGANLLPWLDSNVPELLRRYRIPAAAVARIDRGRVSFTRVYGERRRGMAAGPNTLFNVASLTKPIAAEVLLRLSARGRLNLDAPMAAQWTDPDLANDPRATQLTVRMALRHRTGLPNWRTDTSNQLSFLQEPDSGFRYSGEGYSYAARYAERVTGTPFETLASRLVFAPLGMRDTAFTLSPGWRERAAYPHDSRGRELWPVVRLDWSAACCLHTTIGDYARFTAAVMQGQGIDPALHRARFMPGVDQRNEMCVGNGLAPEMCPTRIAMGLGWMIFGFGDETVITHTGINDGERAAVFFVPERDFAIVILTNGANGTRLIRDITAAAYDNEGYRRLTAYLAR
jgi:CubicO group peptidase (beta-lactamase class C family)